jgi:signal peptidase I
VRRHIVRYGALLLLLAGVLYLVTEWLLIPSVVVGSSMAPTLQHGDLILVDVWSYRQRSPRPGEIVLFSGPLPGGAHLLKRVSRPQERGKAGFDAALWREGSGRPGSSLWLVGDNPESSVDSREFGLVPEEKVKGRAFFRYWPLSRAGSIR